MAGQGSNAHGLTFFWVNLILLSARQTLLAGDVEEASRVRPLGNYLVQISTGASPAQVNLCT